MNEKTTGNVTFETLPKAVENLERLTKIILDKFDDLNSKLLNQPTDDLMTREEVANFFKVDLSTIHNWVGKGKLTKYCIGGRVYFKKSEISQATLHIPSTY